MSSLDFFIYEFSILSLRPLFPVLTVSVIPLIYVLYLRGLDKIFFSDPFLYDIVGEK